jgi:nucleotide-binding universal stress UspA family protein
MKILLPLDGAPCSAAAVDAVVAQFRRQATEVRILHVVEWPRHVPMHVTMAEGPTGASDLIASRDAAFREGETLTGRAAEQLRADGFRTATSVKSGSARELIIEEAAEWKPDLIVMGSHGWKGLDRFLMGSVSEAIVRRAACSVEVVRPPLASPSRAR